MSKTSQEGDKYQYLSNTKLLTDARCKTLGSSRINNYVNVPGPFEAGRGPKIHSSTGPE
jgi:hypothetical protein